MASTKGRRAFWEQAVKEQGESGLTGLDWCGDHGVAVAAFYRWRKKLTVEPATCAPAAPTSSEVEWLPIEPRDPLDSTPSRTHSSSGVTLRIGSVYVEIVTGFDHQALADVLAVLTPQC